MNEDHWRLYECSPIQASLQEELTRRIHFVDDGIESYRLRLNDEGEIVGIWIKGAFNLADTASAAVCRLFKEVAKHRSSSAMRTWTHNWDVHPKARGHQRLLSAAIDRGLVRVHGPGTVSFNGSLVHLRNSLVELVSQVSTGLSGATEYVFPTLLSSSVLERGGYIESFPNLLMRADRVRTGSASYKAVTTSLKQGLGFDSAELDLVATGYSLPPTMCYYVYDSLADTVVPDGKTFTAIGKSFRFEHVYEEPFKRLWDFTIRETVWVGTRSYCKAGLSAHMNAITSLCDSLELSGECVTAHDPFFAGEAGAQLANAQELVGSKFELKLLIDPNDPIACGSFNFHGTSIASRYNITLHDGSSASTACVGIGIERLMWTVLAQHGLDPKHWPEILQLEALSDPT